MVTGDIAMRARHWQRIGACLIGLVLIGLVLNTRVGRSASVQALSPGTGSISSNLYGAGCSGSICIAVGAGGTILQDRNLYWGVQASGTSTDLYDVACVKDTGLCFAVGAGGTILTYSDGTLKPNGIVWGSEQSGSASNLYGVTCPSTKLCFAVGANGTLVQYNGGGWFLPLPFPPAPAGVSGDLNDVACASASLCFVVGGGGRIFRYNGSDLTLEASGTSATLDGVDCPSTNLCFAVGTGGAILQYNGSSWGSQPSGTSNELISVSCLNTALCFAVGKSGTMLQYNGVGWGLVQPSVTSNDLRDVSCPETNLCAAVGLNDTLLQYNGNGWATQTTGGLTVTYPAGWNLVGVPTGTVITSNVGSLYTYQANDTSYETVPAGTPLQGGVGYWVYFAAPTKVTLLDVPTMTTVTMSLPANHWVMVGNPSNVSVAFSGASAVYAYSPSTGYNTHTFELAPGQGAWVYSQTGGTLSIDNAPPPATPFP